MNVHIKHIGTQRRVVENTTVRNNEDACSRMNSYYVYIYLMIAENGLIDVREVPTYEGPLLAEGNYKMKDDSWRF